MHQTPAYVAQSAGKPLTPYKVDRREPSAKDVAIDITHCGVCHSDIHQVRDEWSAGIFPMVPGHEIIGTVKKVGAEVKKFKVGDRVGVGCMVDSCRRCQSCKDHLEQYCEGGATMTYNSKDKGGKATFGGYSKHIVVDQDFVLSIPKNIDSAKAAPLLCAGITTYSPLRHWKVGKKSRIGIIGLGGLGHMATKFARAFGATTVVLTHSPSKKDAAIALGADEVIVTRDEGAFQKHAGTFDFLLSTISAEYNIDNYLGLLKHSGAMILVGVPDKPPALHIGSLIPKRKTLAGSLIGGIKETQEMLDFCGEHNIGCDVETIAIKDINTAFERMLKSDVRYRFVIDMATL